MKTILHSITTRITTARAAWISLGATLVAAGFLCDGVTEVGHHAFLILGGMLTGYGAAKSGR